MPIGLAAAGLRMVKLKATCPLTSSIALPSISLRTIQTAWLTWDKASVPRIWSRVGGWLALRDPSPHGSSEPGRSDRSPAAWRSSSVCRRAPPALLPRNWEHPCGETVRGSGPPLHNAGRGFFAFIERSELTTESTSAPQGSSISSLPPFSWILPCGHHDVGRHRFAGVIG